MIIPIMTRKDFSSGNPGDVYIVLGLQYLLNKINPSLQYFYFNKFSQDDFEKNKDILSGAGFIIYAGTPQYNNYDDWCLWYDWNVWTEYFIPLNIDFYSIAGGAGFPSISMDTKQFSEYCLSSYKTKSILNSRKQRTKLNTVRDKYAYQLLNDIKQDTVLLPCTATWAAKYLNIQYMPLDKKLCLIPPNPKSVLASFYDVMTDEERDIEVIKQWTNIYNFLINEGYDVEMVCHSKNEYNLFKHLDNVFFTNDVIALMNKLASAEIVFSSRLHACLPAVGLGVKKIISIAIDTRSSATEIFNIPSLNINNLTENNIKDVINMEYNKNLIYDYEKEYIELLKNNMEFLCIE